MEHGESVDKLVGVLGDDNVPLQLKGYVYKKTSIFFFSLYETFFFFPCCVEQNVRH